jgi:hypothetical protein
VNSADRRRGPRSVLALVFALALGVGAAGCGAGIGTPPVPSSVVAALPSPSAGPPAIPSSDATATASASPVAGTATPRLLIVDPTLLEILPERVDGVAIVAAPETAAGMTSDLELGRSASAIDVGIAVGPGDSEGDDLALASVVRLRPGIFSDLFFAGWRTAYDAAACATAGGVSNHRRQVVGGHAVEVAGCAGGVTIYHVHLANDLLVSITAAGHRKFGELILAGLRE